MGGPIEAIFIQTTKVVECLLHKLKALSLVLSSGKQQQMVSSPGLHPGPTNACFLQQQVMYLQAVQDCLEGSLLTAGRWVASTKGDHRGEWSSAWPDLCSLITQDGSGTDSEQPAHPRLLSFLT